MSVNNFDVLRPGYLDDPRGETAHEQELAREGQTPPRPAGPIVPDAVHKIATVAIGPLLGRGQDDRFKPQPLLGRHDTAASVAIPAPERQGVIEHMKDPRGRPGTHARVPRTAYLR